MSKVILIGGYGPGISNAVAERFGAEGFSLALVARNAERLTRGVTELRGKGFEAQAFPADLGQPDQVREMVRKVRGALGSISVLHWNAYSSSAGDLLAADTSDVRAAIEIAVLSPLAAVQEALPDLRAQKGALLVTNGGLALFDPAVDAMSVSWNVMGLAVANSAKHKLVGLLSAKLKEEGVYVGEVMVTATVKGTAFDQGNATLDPAVIAAKFWELFESRSEVSARI